MGHRTIKRVPLNFNWTLNQAWKGYLNPYKAYLDCKACDSSGMNPKTKKLSDDWYTHLRTDGLDGWGKHLEQEDVQALIDGDRLWDFTRTPRNEEQLKIVKEKLARGENSWLPFNNGYVPTAEEVNNWNKKGFGHDSINQWICVEARAKRMGIYGYCEHCKGEGYIPVSNELVKLHEEWKKYEPPTGPGYQLWETCSEGSPISPVFETPEMLAKWCVDGATIFATEKLSYDKWLELIKTEDKDNEMDNASLMIMNNEYIGSVANCPNK